jgi:6-phosphogluconolactonase (cycloisomerase 2 family)
LAASAAVLGVVPQALAGTVRSIVPGARGKFAFVGSSPSEGTGAIHVFDASTPAWRAVQTVPAVAPAHLELHPSLSVLYAVHSTETWENLPRGAVSSYSFSKVTGELTLLNTQPLSLSATSPEHATVTRDGKHLLVAAKTGGVYNLFPLAKNGSLQAPISIVKELGLKDGASAAKTSQPRFVVSHPDSDALLTADSGNEAINTFSLETGALRPQHRRRVHAGAGPSQIALTPRGQFVYALNAEDGSITTHRFDTSAGRVASSLQRIAANAGSLAMHPSGRFLLTTGASEDAGLYAWQINRLTGRLTAMDTAPQSSAALRSLAFSRNGDSLLGVDVRTGQVLATRFYSKSGSFASQTVVARVDSAISLALRA